MLSVENAIHPDFHAVASIHKWNQFAGSRFILIERRAVMIM
jgi:hypothetical protein